MKTNKKKYLIIRLSSMGDVVLTTPFIRCIHNQCPGSIIDFIVSNEYSSIIKNNPYINNVIEYDKNNSNYNKKIKNKLDTNYSIIDLQNNHRSKIFRKGIGKVVSSFNKFRLKKLAIVWLKKNHFYGITIPERYINTASSMNVKNDNKGLEIWLPEENKSKTYPPENKIYSNIITKIAIAPSATHYTKRWLPDHFVELINMLHNKYTCEFHLLGDNNDKQICQYIISHSNDNINIIDHSGQTSILDAVRIIDKSSLIISNDTGVMHIASARKIPIVAIYGSTVPELGFVPYKVPHQICEVKLKCRPCTHIGKKQCSKRHFNCMKLLTPEIVFQKIETFVKSIQ